MPEFLKLLPADEARRILAQTPPVDGESVALAEAAGRVLAEPFHADEDLPAWPRSTVDGYAVSARDVAGASDGTPSYLRVVGTVPMGGVFAGRVNAGQAVAISTGGCLPEGADAVVMIEYATPIRGAGSAEGEFEIEVGKGLAAGHNVIRPGEDIRRGEEVLSRGRRLRPQDLAALASYGRTEVQVFRRPRIAVLSTGNELCDPALRPAPGQVRDVNQSVLAAQITAAGCEVTRAGIVRDDAEALHQALTRLLETHDGVVVSGGSSVGVRDVSADVLGRLGPPGILFHGISVRPGKPTIFARVGKKPVLGMPGFPTSSMIIFDAFVRPLLWRLGGENDRPLWPAHRRARLSRRHASQAGREDYLRVRLGERDGVLWAEPLLGGSAAINNVIRADGLVCVDAGSEGIAEGEEVEVLLY